MIEVTVKNVGCTTQDGIESCTGVLDLSVNDAVQLVKDLSITLESAMFDRLMYDYFKIITDNPCAICEECDKEN